MTTIKVQKPGNIGTGEHRHRGTSVPGNIGMLPFFFLCYSDKIMGNVINGSLHHALGL